MVELHNIARFKVFLKDSNRKSIFKIIKELMVLAKLKQERPYYYFKYIYRRHVKNYEDYLSASEMNLIRKSKRLHHPKYETIMNNKLSFSQWLETSEVSTPKLVSYNLKNNFHFNNIQTKINDSKGLSDFFKNTFTVSKVKSIFFRPLSDYGGKGCFKIAEKDLETDLKSVYNKLISGDFLHTETVEQHEAINAIHGSSINTIRMLSLITTNSTIEIICAFMRFGVGNSVVDNASSGGFVVGIDMKDGSLKKCGHYLLEYGGAEIYQHPDSGFTFAGFKIPYFKEACQEVIKGVKALPDGFIGWDVAITPSGPTIIEANDMPHLHLSDVTYGGLLQNPHINNLIEELSADKLA